jgi:hypothetical protein
MTECLALLALVMTGAPLLQYVECSNGLGTPAMEGGRTELEFADLDNDGNPDLLMIGDHGSPYINTDEHGVTVWFGDGHGNWNVYQYGDFGYGGIAVGDVNGDGLWDIGYGMHHNYSSTDLGDQLLEVALGDGTGRMWIPWDDSLAQEGQNWGMFSTDFADLDNDGDLDIGSISFGADDGIHVYSNLGNGAWRRTFGFSGGNSRMEFYFRDVNHDGNADMIAAHGYGSVWFGDGAGGMVSCDTGLPSSSYGLAGLSVGDVDNDGGCDVAFVNASGGLEVWVWDDLSHRWQSRSGTLPVADSFYATQLCDMNADGFIDLCGLRRGLVRIYAGDGSGNWTEAAEIALNRPNSYSAFRVGADIDHNGLPDMVMVTREGNWPNDRNYAHAFRETSPAESLGIFAVFPRGGEKFKNGSVQFVDWWSSAPAAESTRVTLDLSTQGSSGPWQLVADSLRNNGRYQWTVPTGVTSPDCFLRYTVSGPGATRSTVTHRPFAVGDTAVGINAGRNEQTLPPRLSVSSPARGLLHGTTNQDGSFLLCDALGRVLITTPARAGKQFCLNAHALGAGTFFLRLESNQGSITRKVVLEP